MEPTVAPPEPEAQSGDISLRDNIVNVEKTEEEEEEHSDSGSAITGVDLIFVAGDDDISIGAECVVERTNMELPEEYANSVMVLTCGSKAEGGSCDVYLIGTAHVSEESCREVEAIVSYMKPEVFCRVRGVVCKPVVYSHSSGCEDSDRVGNDRHVEEETQPIRNSLRMIASKLDVLPGAEFRVAYEEAVKYGGQVILGDRPVQQITLKRTWAKMPIWHKVKFLYGLVFQAVFLPSPEELEKMLKAMNDVDMLTLVIQQMSKEFPSLMDTLVHERDKYMSCMLSRVACEHSSVVAVVGRGHLQGIKKNWDQPINMKDLLEIPTNKSVFTVKNVLKSLAVLVIGAAIVSRIYLVGRS
ncbi:hypothetical protein HID58_017837 [Brassica napus]|uniref:TraB family protein n=1 Tax=Brassica napus TaxID=3708 RepID=A0ABQ8DB02_BRANA|nr:hypothetical protein HID58_017837 [Brassica napus]